MEATPATIYSLWTLAGLTYLYLRVIHIRRQRRIMRSLQTAVRQKLRAA
jgi:hypothetical protein